MSLRFVWDPRKEALNQRKHGIAFAEALTVFADPLALVFDDPAHSRGEHREIIIGHSSSDTLRIISARQATARERHDYQENRGA